MNRNSLIKRRLTKHFRDDLGLVVLAADLSTWRRVRIAPRYRFGWAPPLEIPNGLLVMFCPELLAMVTEGLDDDDFDRYLTMVETYIDAFVWKGEEGVDGDVEKFVEDLLHAKAPSSLLMMLEVEARAIDRGLIASL